MALAPLPLPSPHLKTCLEDVWGGVLPPPPHTSPMAKVHPFPFPRGYLRRSKIRDMGQKGLQNSRQFPFPHFWALTLGMCICGPFSLLVLS